MDTGSAILTTGIQPPWHQSNALNPGINDLISEHIRVADAFETLKKMLGDLAPEVVQSIVRQVAEADIDSLYSFRNVCKSFLGIVDDWMVEPHASDILVARKVLGASMAAYLVHRPSSKSFTVIIIKKVKKSNRFVL